MCYCLNDLWNILQIARAAGLECFEEELFKYFETHMVKNIVTYQGHSESVVPSFPVCNLAPIQNLDELGLEIVKCCKGLRVQQNHQSLQIGLGG